MTETSPSTIYQGKRVVILGYGIEGESTYKYFVSRGADVTIADGSLTPARHLPEDAKTVLGPDYLDKIADFDIVCRTPSLPPTKIHTNGEITSATREFLKYCPAKVIGVTGTKGKGTTTSLIGAILSEAGFKTHLLGNIGNPVLDELGKIQPDDLVCFEMSSFQLWDVTQSPQTAVVLMVETDHLDVHGTLENYYEAKKNIARFQSPNDTVIYHANNKNSVEIATCGAGKKIRYLTDEGAFIRGEDIIINEHKISSIHEVGLIGRHNLENVAAAITAAWIYTQNVPAIAKAVREFKGLKHRLEFVREINGVQIYNDSYSSATLATQAALNSFSQPKVLLLGGKNRGSSYQDVLKVLQNTQVRKVIIYGENRQTIAQTFRQNGYENFELLETQDFSQIVKTAFNHCQSGDVLLLSPGAPSFDMFKNFEQRGEEFKRIVNEEL